MAYARRLFVFCKGGTMGINDGLSMDGQGSLCFIESSYVDEFYQYEFKHINSCGVFTLALDTDGQLYYWGENFIKKRESKADYEIHSTPQLINFPKEVEDVYATYDAAFLKNGLEIYVITRQE